MVDTVVTPGGAPIITADPFSLENLMEPHELHAQIREAGPVVYLEAYDVWAMARYEEVNASLKDYETFSSGAGAGLSNFRKEKPWRTPSLLLEADPPFHTRAREVVGPITAPPVLKALRGDFEAEVVKLVDQLLTLGSFDVITQFAEVFPLKVFGDAVGLPEEGRENLLPYANNASGHVGFGMGIHRCVGQTVARVEVEILLNTLLQRVERIEITGQPQRKPNNTMRAWSSLPVTIHPIVSL